MATNLRFQSRALYRRFLRELPSATHPITPAHSPALRARIRENFESTNQSLSQLKAAEQFLCYLKAQRSYTRLIERYNPGMGMEEAERIRLTARRVGMDLPIEHKDSN